MRHVDFVQVAPLGSFPLGLLQRGCGQCMVLMKMSEMFSGLRRALYLPLLLLRLHIVSGSCGFDL